MAGVPFTCQASTDHWDSADRTEPMLAAEPTESTDAIEPADPIDKIDPAEPMDRIDPADPMDRIDPLDPMLKMEPSVFRMRSFWQCRRALGVRADLAAHDHDGAWRVVHAVLADRTEQGLG